METLLTKRRLCTFYAGPLFLGVDITNVQEVIRVQDMTPIPLAGAVIKGLINLRGQIVTAVDVRQTFGLAPRPADQPPMNVVIQINGEAVSLLVDTIGDILDVGEADFEMVPETVTDNVRLLLRGAYKLQQGRLLLWLDLHKALAAAGEKR
jgi:purine-binding chemotaxis protein CheW